MERKYMIVDTLGRLWARSLTAIKARRIVAKLLAEKGISAHIEQMGANQ